MDVLKIGLYIVWGIAFIAWLVNLILNIKYRDRANQMLVFVIIMLCVSCVNLMI